jgi:NADH:ubiquinone oxidoreductase subunit E
MTSSNNLLQSILAKHRDEKGALLPILKDVQHEYGYVSPEAINAIADFLRLSAAQVVGVLTFYNEFTTAPQGKKVIHVCNGPSCRVRGGLQVEDALRETLGLEPEETSADGSFTLKTSTCLGLCAHAPAIQVNGDLLGEVTTEKALRVIDGEDIEEIRAGDGR